MGRRGLQLGSHRSSEPGRREWAVADCSWRAICHVSCHSYLSTLLSFLSVISSGMYFVIYSAILICHSYLSFLLAFILSFLLSFLSGICSVISSVILIWRFFCHYFCHFFCHFYLSFLLSCVLVRVLVRSRSFVLVPDFC